MSLTTLGEVPRAVFRFSRVAVERISNKLIFNCVVRKLTLEQKRGLCLINFFFLARKMKNELLRISRNCDNREAGNWSGHLSESSQTYSEKSRLDFLSVRGEN